jgi:hypothetical protein
VSRTQVTITNPTDTAQIAEAVSELQRIVDARVEFGNPQDPNGPTTTLAGSGTPTTHNGQTMNILGRWVELEFTALDTEVVANHNLSVEVFNTEVNVRWIVMGIRHSGDAANGTAAISIIHEDGGTLTADTLGLRAYCAATRTVDADNPIRVSLFFTPASRWPA